MIVKQMSLVMLLMVTLWGPLPQEAITLMEADPAPQSTLRDPLRQVTMRFSAPVEEGTFTVSNTTGMRFEPVSVTLSGRQVTLAYPAGLPEGGYQVTWQVTSPDGLSSEGDFSFTLRLPPPSLQFVTPQDGQKLPPGTLTLDVALQGISISASEVQVQFEIAGQTLTADTLPVTFNDLPPGIYTITAVVLRGETPIEATRQRITVALTPPPPPQPTPPTPITVEPTTGAEAIASVVGVILLLGLGMLLGARQKPLS